MASSNFNPHITLEVEEEYTYPYPSHVCAPNFVTLNLSGKEEYDMWKTQMLCLLESHGMLGFINGTLACPQTSNSGKEKVGDDHRLWRRSDALVKGWILGSFSKQTLRFVLDRLQVKLHLKRYESDFGAKDVWDELQTMYDPPVLQQQKIVDGPDVLQDRTTEDKKKEEERAKSLQSLYEYTLRGNWHSVESWLERGAVTLIDKVTKNGNTALHVAVGTSKDSEFFRKMLDMAPRNTQLLDVRNSDGSTLLHVAAIVGNTEAAKILVKRNPDLLLAKDNEGHTPLALALSNMHTQTSKYLLEYDNIHIERYSLLSGRSGDELLVTVISSKDFHLANHLAKNYETLHSDTVLMALAQNFPCQPNILGRSLVRLIRRLKRLLITTPFEFALRTAIENPRMQGLLRAAMIFILFLLLVLLPVMLGIFMTFLPFVIALILVWPFLNNRFQNYDKATQLLGRICELISRSSNPSSEHQYYTNPIFEATRQNAYGIVKEVVSRFPNAIHSANEDGHNIIQYAVISRSEKVYNLLYRMSEHKNVYRTLRDSSGNNLLHLAGRLAPTNKLNLVSGAALQIQSELQWFKEVEGFVCPLNIIQKNSLEETPQMVFTREHKELVIEGEKWMKATAESYTITAALIITIVFAAGITVPGGSNQDTGGPVFTNKPEFTIFAISDAISLFAAVTSLLMFLSILTARFAEQDFLFTLPTKLIIGLATLFISTTAMIIAFGATLYLVFGQTNSKILIPIVVLTCLPITCFMTLQFPLIIDLMSSTYGRSIFGKKNHIYNYREFGSEIDQHFY